jgi:oligoribonuclease
MSERQHQFLWLDLETTGLDPVKGKILEWAVVLAADDAEGDLEPVESFSSVVKVPRAEAWALSDDYVRKMHTANGLFDACDQAENTLEAGESFIIDLIGGPAIKGVILAGSSVHFDLSWIRVHMPRLAACLSYRVLDVSTIKILERAYFDPAFSVDADKVVKHRALDDVLASLTAARAYHAKRTELARKARAFDALCAERPGVTS